MKAKVIVTMLGGMVFALAIAAAGQTLERPNVIWARSTAGAAITLDGKLDEPAWGKAEAVRIQHGKSTSLIPGSGWYNEAGVPPSDPTDAVLKFLVDGNTLYMAAVVKDSSVGGGLFNKFDGFLMNMRDHSKADRPAPPFEYFYGWVTETWADTTLGEVGKLPGFFGWASGDRSVWDAVTTVQGLSNSDATIDEGYTTEFKFNLTPRGYDVTKSEGDVVEFNVSIYDADWQWPLQPGKFSGNRTWWQGPWGNASAYDVIRIYARPDVTVNSGSVPEVGPEVIIPNAANHAAPVIDGKLDEPVWQNAPGLDIRYGDDALRASYSGIGPYRSGQFQPKIGDVTASVLDGGDASIKWFFQGDKLYLGVDVRDQAVWSINNRDQWDGIQFIINDRAAINPDDHNLERRELTVRFDSTGALIKQDYLVVLVDSFKTSQAAVAMKPNTTVNNFNDADEGYQIELAIDLTKLGYPVDRGDGVLFLSATLFDGDNFLNPADNYGTRTWWMREGSWNAGPAWAYMDASTFVPDGAPLTILERPNVIWARSTAGAAITLDGKLDEPAWGKAEAVRIQHGKSTSLIPGSGWYNEAGVPPSDPTDAVLKFLVDGNTLYMAAVVKDSSVGGGLFNKFDGFLMNMRDHSKADRPAPPFEYFYGWVTETWADTTLGEVGKLPGFFGWASGDRSVWDAVTTVQGLSNSDATIDEGYTTEFKFNLTPRGYDVTKSEGDVVEFNVSIYDADWQWPLQPGKFSGNRTWWQGPWGNASAYDVIRIYARPDVTVNSGSVPEVGPEVIIPNAANHAAPVIDGKLDEPVWQNAPGLDIRYGDDALRASYSGIGPYRSGQFQPKIGDVTASVLDGGDASIKWFFQGDKLYLGVDVRDQAVWSINNRDQWDGIQFIINDRAAINPDDHNLERRELTVRFDSTGALIKQDYLVVLVDSFKTSQAAVAMKPNTTVNNFNDADEGYQIELAIDLTKLGYPVDRGDGVLFLSATLFDGDNFLNPADNYGTRTWWMREGSWNAGPAWAYMDPATVITGVKNRPDNGLPKTFSLLGNYPNPFNPTTTIRYTMPEPGSVTLKVYDILGRSVAIIPLGLQQPGYGVESKFDASNLSSGVYFYRLQVTSETTKKTLATLYGKMMVLK